MTTVTESIYSGKGVIIPLADVQHIELHNKNGLIVVTKHTKYNCERDVWENNIWVDKEEAEAFKAAWCRYRHELEKPTLKVLYADEKQNVWRDDSGDTWEPVRAKTL